MSHISFTNNNSKTKLVEADSEKRSNSVRVMELAYLPACGPPPPEWTGSPGLPGRHRLPGACRRRTLPAPLLANPPSAPPGPAHSGTL